MISWYSDAHYLLTCGEPKVLGLEIVDGACAAAIQLTGKVLAYCQYSQLSSHTDTVDVLERRNDARLLSILIVRPALRTR